MGDGPAGSASANVTNLSVGAEAMVVARLFAVAFLGLMIWWVELPHKPIVAAILGATAVGHVAWWWIFVKKAHAVTYVTALATLLVDTIGIGVAVLLTGGADSPAVLVWPANVAVAAIWVGVRRSVPVIVAVGAFLAAGVIVDPASQLVLSELQYAVMLFGMLVLVLTHGGIVAARQHAAVREIVAAEARALRDPLTGLANRRAFEEALPGELERSARYGRPVTLLMIDLDDFKTVNDTHGHLAGDAVLVDLACQLQSEMRASDMVVRLGGEEFVMVLPETDVDHAYLIAERLRTRVLASPAMDGVTVSIGVATAPTAATTAMGLIHEADEALYAAKRAGKNRTVVAAAGSR